MAKTAVIYQGLINLPVLIEDTSATSPNYFHITKLPSTFTAGVNFVQFKGNPSLFPENTEVQVEVLDSNGEPIYYEVDVNVDNGEATAVISVHVNQDTAPGTAYIILCSTAQYDINGNKLDTSLINIRWIGQTYVDIKKANDAEIIFDVLPTTSVFNYTGSYVNYLYTGIDGSKIQTVTLSDLKYYYYNGSPFLTTGSLTGTPFDNTALNATVKLKYSDLSNTFPSATATIDSAYEYTSSVDTISSNGILSLTNALTFPIVNSNTLYIPQTATVSATISYEQSASLGGNATENKHNLAVVYFDNLQPLTGTISKIRSYYKSSGVGEYIYVNETDISGQAVEFGFTANSVTASFFMPTVHRNDRLDFKFEFVNPYGVVSKQYVESLNNLFLGGNTYIGGGDNLLTGSLFVAGVTGTGVEITGKGNASVVKSIGYQGLQKAQAGTAAAGFVLYSGSIQSVIGSTEAYDGVGLDLVANANSYFQYTTANGGLLDIHTDKFFIGNNNVFLSGSNGNLEILVRDPVPPLTKFHLQTSGEVTASALVVYTGSSDIDNYLQLDTKAGLVDGKNIGRVLYTQYQTFRKSSTTTSIPSTNTTSSAKIQDLLGNGAVSWSYSSLPSNFTFFGLPYESRITILGTVFVQRSSTGGGGTEKDFCVFLRSRLFTINTGSYSAWGDRGLVQLTGYSGSVQSTFQPSGSTYTIARNTTVNTFAQMVPFKIDLQLTTDMSNRHLILEFDQAECTFTSAGTVEWSYQYAIGNLTVLTGRSFFNVPSFGYGSSYNMDPGKYR